jgi:hypothetical protein
MVRLVEEQLIRPFTEVCTHINKLQKDVAVPQKLVSEQSEESGYTSLCFFETKGTAPYSIPNAASLSPVTDDQAREGGCCSSEASV